MPTIPVTITDLDTGDANTVLWDFSDTARIARRHAEFAQHNADREALGMPALTPEEYVARMPAKTYETQAERHDRLRDAEANGH